MPTVHDQRWPISVIERPLIDIVRRPATDRWSMDPRQLLIGSDYLFAHHQARFRDEPAMHADFLNVAGVAAARLGDYSLARQRFRHAVRVRPVDRRSWARLALASVPPAGRRVWGRPPG
jgi:hypothetical protein